MANLPIVASVIDKTKPGLASAGKGIQGLESKTSKFGKVAKGAALGVAGIAVAGAAACRKICWPLTSLKSGGRHRQNGHGNRHRRRAACRNWVLRCQAGRYQLSVSSRRAFRRSLRDCRTPRRRALGRSLRGWRRWVLRIEDIAGAQPG